MSRIALATGANQGLGLALVAGLAQRLDRDDVVYLTGRNQQRLAAAAASINGSRAKVRTELLDVATVDSANHLGTTRTLRAFAPILRDSGRLIVVASSLGTLHWLAPVLHERFEDLPTLAAVDEVTCAWRDAVRDGSAFWDVSGAPTPAQAAVPLIDLVLDEIPLDTYYGQLIRGTTVLPWKP